MDTISRAAGPVFKPGTMTNMLRNLSIKVCTLSSSYAPSLEGSDILSSIARRNDRESSSEHQVGTYSL